MDTRVDAWFSLLQITLSCFLPYYIFEVPHWQYLIFFANRVAGTAGAVVTCPLEVVKTRLQSSNPVFGNSPLSGPFQTGGSSYSGGHGASLSSGVNPSTGFSSKTRMFSTCVNCGRNAHILAVARGHQNSPMPANNVPKIGLLQCLRYMQIFFMHDKLSTW